MDTIKQKIQAALLGTLQTITVAGGYQVTLAVDTRSNDVDNLGHLKAILIASEPERVERTNAHVRRKVVFSVVVGTIPSEASDPDLDTLQEWVWADVDKAVMALRASRWSLVDTVEVLEPINLLDAVVVPIEIVYATQVGNQYAQ